MSEWRKRELGELVAAAGGYVRTGPFGSQLHAQEYTDDPFGIPVVMPKDMVHGRVDRTSVSRVDHQTAERLKVHRLAAGDVVFARRGDVGRFAAVADDEAGWLCGTGSMRVHAPDHELLCSGFLRHAMSHPDVGEWLAGQAVGATMPNLNAEIVSRLPLSVPLVATQRRIAALLSAFDELIEINERRIELLEDLARSLYREWFVRFRFPGHEDVEFVDSELGPIPDGWEVRTFESTGEFLNGFAFKPAHWGTEGLPIIKIKELKQGATPNTPRYAGDDVPHRYVVKPGALLFSWSADLGVYLWPGESGWLNQHLFKITPAAGIPQAFLFHALDQALPGFRERAQGTTMKHIKRSALREVACVVPTSEMLVEFAGAVEPMHAEILMLSEANDRVAATRDLLLPRLVTGQLNISDIDLGGLLPAEPA